MPEVPGVNASAQRDRPASRRRLRPVVNVHPVGSRRRTARASSSRASSARQALPELDPFLLLDAFHSDDPKAYIAGFPDHPHRGFETVTYMLAGRMRHRDNKGHSGLLGPGGVQWMTAGRGIVHSEMPEQESGLSRDSSCGSTCRQGQDDRRALQDIPAADIPGPAIGDAWFA